MVLNAPAHGWHASRIERSQSRGGLLPCARARLWLGHRWALLILVAAWSAIAFRPALGQIIMPPVAVSTMAEYENEPQVVAVGDLVFAVWSWGVFTNAANWGASDDGGLTWSVGQGFPFLVDVGIIDPQPTICSGPLNRIYAATLSQRFGEQGIGFYAGSWDGSSLSWSLPVLAVPLIDEGTFQHPYEMPHLVCDPDRDHIYLFYIRVHVASPDFTSFEHTLEYVRSTDGGLTWTAPVALSGTTSGGPGAAVGPDGEVYVFWQDLATQQLLARKSSDFGVSFGPAFAVAPMLDNFASGPPGYRPRLERESPVYLCGCLFAPNIPSVAVDRSSGPERGRVYVTWSERSSGVVSPIVETRFEQEPNDGLATATPVAVGQMVEGQISNPDDVTADTDVFVFEGTAGTIVSIEGGVGGMSGLNCSPIRECHSFELWCESDLLGSPVRLAVAGMHSGAAPMIVTLPVTGPYYVIVGPAGPCSVSYGFRLQTLSPDGVVAQDHRDVVLVSSGDGGSSWSPKVRVNDDPAGVDNSFPAVAVDGSGDVHVAWYDRRDDPDCGALAETYWARSSNGGQIFEPSRRLSSEPSRWESFYSPTNTGDHLAIAASGDRVHVLWTQMGQPNVDIYGVTIRDDPVAVAVGGLDAEVLEGGVRLSWYVFFDEGIVGFRPERSAGSSEIYAPLSDTPLAAEGEGRYESWDVDVTAGVRYRYRLAVLRSDGLIDVLGPVDVSIPAGPTRLALRNPAPNPFQESLEIELAVPRAGVCWVRVLDVAGREVSTILRRSLPPGKSILTWDGRDREGHAVPPGLYFVQAVQGGESQTIRIARIP